MALKRGLLILFIGVLLTTSFASAQTENNSAVIQLVEETEVSPVVNPPRDLYGIVMPGIPTILATLISVESITKPLVSPDIDNGMLFSIPLGTDKLT